MKKRILSVLLALMLVVSLVPNHVHAADECTHDFDYTTGICNLCSYECPHEGELVRQWSLGEHWPRCWDCLYHMGENEPHTIVDGECSVCNYAPCTHSAAYWEDYAGGHRKICPDCYDMVLVEWEAHIDENGDSACDVCGNPTCAEHTLVKAGITHSCQNCSYYLFCLDDNNDCICDIGGEVYHDLSKATWERSETQHRHICGNCGEVASEWVDHSLDENDVCYDCGYGCAHENMNDYCYCYDCRQDLHTDADGDKVCDKCHWCVLGHDSNFGSYCEFDIYVQFCGATCTICGNFVAEGHYDPEETGTCEWCGYTPCTGDHVFVDGICTACGGKCWYIDDDGDGACDSCGYVCSHKNTEWSYDVDGYHVLTCYDCYTSIDSGYHTLKDGKCTVCGAKPCAYGTHTFGKDHICTACGAESGCRDENGDCACDICGVVIHGLEIREYNDTQHRTVCADCGKTTMEWTDHVYDEEGGCYDCGYGCEHASAECYNWDDYHVVH